MSSREQKDLRYTSGEFVFTLLDEFAGDVRMLSLNWLLSHAKSGRPLPRRQELPPEAFADMAALRKVWELLHAGNRFQFNPKDYVVPFISISYAWCAARAVSETGVEPASAPPVSARPTPGLPHSASLGALVGSTARMCGVGRCRLLFERRAVGCPPPHEVAGSRLRTPTRTGSSCGKWRRCWRRGMSSARRMINAHHTPPTRTTSPTWRSFGVTPPLRLSSPVGVSVCTRPRAMTPFANVAQSGRPAARQIGAACIRRTPHCLTRHKRPRRSLTRRRELPSSRI